MKFRLKQMSWIFLGIIFFILGFIGLFVPILPGPIFILFGAICFGVEKKIVNYYLTNYLKKFKKKLK